MTRRRPVTPRERRALYGAICALGFTIGLVYGDALAFWWL